MTIRPANDDDLMFIARGFQTAMLMDDITEERTRIVAEGVCAKPGVLYSPANTVIAEVDGERAGMITAYDGAGYRRMRETTMPLFKELLGVEFPDMEDEAEAGEYYLDSLAVMPEHRGNGIGRQLLRYAIARGTERGLKVTLAVDPVNERAQRLYQSLGFVHERDIFIFGHTYWKWKYAGR